ncbi:hypothetical protein BST81_20375 [Leptolyngbya sp. 'hensonii']|nr:hypothetical protein BST81_20375 [Leptolyngbya sp. 'hensonii']
MPDLLTEIFPFHIAFNRNHEIVQVGKVIQQLYPNLQIGSQLEQHFRIDRPKIPLSFDRISQQSGALFLLESLHNRMKLKGQMMYIQCPEVMLFLCSPWVTDLASLKAFGLSLNQFAIHDPVVDFLFLLQAQNTALSDAKKLTDQLTEQRTELRKTNQRLAALYTVTHILTESATFNEAMVQLLEALCMALDWQVGVLWMVDQQSNVLKCQEVWTTLPEFFAEFETLNRVLTFAPGTGLPGQVWEERKTAWIEDISSDPNSPRRLHAVHKRLQGVFALPIQDGSELIGVLEFFSHKPCQPDDSLLEMMTDISIKIGQFAQRKIIETALIKQTEISESLKSILDSMGDAVIVADEQKNFLVFNPAAERMFKTQPHNLTHNQWLQQVELYQDDHIIPFHPEDLPLDRSIRGEEVNDVEMLVCQPHAPDGIWITVTGRPIKDKDGVVKGGVVVCRDITERKRVEKQLLYDAFHDGLTGLANRVLFMERLQHASAMAKRNKTYLFAVLFLDLDRFKVINDSLGHMVGDQLLIAIARRLEGCLREGDTISRLGGDEFAILLEGIKNSDYATQVAERVQRELMKPFMINGNEIFASTSIGIAFSTNEYGQPEDLLRDADTAMYHAKNMGKARYQIFDSAMHLRAVKLLQLETDLRRAIERQEFEVYYQSIVSLKTQKITGFEALVRWKHPERGFISPVEFIPIAEETGLILPLGSWVLQEACQQMRRWQQEFPNTFGLTISVNISGKQFFQEDFTAQIQHILKETGLNPRCLKLEITESIFMDNVPSTTATLLDLQALGIQLSMDDFGTGYSSLSYLNRFPIDTLKIDRSFIQVVDTDIEKLEIVRTVVLLAQNLGMNVVAEGVETASQLDQLRELNCESAQGYFFSKPLTWTAARTLIKESLTL